jgi:plastocyanin
MRRTVGASAVVVIAVALTAVPGPAPAAPAPVAGCTWRQHAKPVVKHVRRHGRVRRVRRVKRWWTCAPQPVALAALPALPVLALPELPPPAEPEPQIARLGVKADEYSYVLSRPNVAAGETIVELDNQGEDPHNLKLQLEGSAEPPLEVPEAGPDERTSARFDLSSGTYRLYCSLFSHEAKGMQATLLVEGD